MKALPPTYQHVGRVISVLRQERGLRQAELAVITGLKQPNLSRIENGVVVPRRATLEKIAEALGVEVTALLGAEQAADVDRKLNAVLSPRNAGQLFANRLSAVPMLRFEDDWAPALDKAGLPAGESDVTLQLLPLEGRAFAWRFEGEAPKGKGGGAGGFAPGEVLVFCDTPEPVSGAWAFVITKKLWGVRRVSFSARARRVRLAPPGGRAKGVEVPRADVLGMWRLARRISDV
ncbi:MAG: helix-turn-helix domain-containing protein [Planctomycetes bacterium]|nr:helix-turn-helix domain-containing protein [Planctomycetota bacterium]